MNSSLLLASFPEDDSKAIKSKFLENLAQDVSSK